jgi:hypothetical protein
MEELKFYQKIFFTKNSTCGGPQGKIEYKSAEGEYSRIFHEKYFLIKFKFFHVVFHADSEYHIYFVRKPIFDSKNLEIRMQFLNFLPPISKNLIFSVMQRNFKKSSPYF